MSRMMARFAVALDRVDAHLVALDAGRLRPVQVADDGSLAAGRGRKGHVRGGRRGGETGEHERECDRTHEQDPPGWSAPVHQAPKRLVSIDHGSGWRFCPRVAHNVCAPGARDPMNYARASRVLSMDSHLDLRAAELAREAEARFRLLVEHSSDGLYLIGPDGHVTYASPPVERLLGFDRRELTGRHFLDYLHPDDRDHAGWFFADVLSKPGVALRARYRCLHRDGEFRHLEAVGVNRLARRRGRRRRRQLPRRHRAAPRRAGARRERGAASAPSSNRRSSASPASTRAAASPTPTAPWSRCSAISSTSCAAASSPNSSTTRSASRRSATGASSPKAASITAAPSAASCAGTAIRSGSTSPPRWCATRKGTRASPWRCSRTSPSASRPRPRSRRPTGGSPAGCHELEERRREIALLSEMGDLLRACRSVEEAYGVVEPMARQLFPEESGAISVIGAGSGLVETVAQWGPGALVLDLLGRRLLGAAPRPAAHRRSRRARPGLQARRRARRLGEHLRAAPRPGRAARRAPPQGRRARARRSTPASAS